MMRIRQLIVSALLILLGLLIPEVMARLFLPQWKPPVSDRPSLFVHHPHLGWTHPPSRLMDHYGGTIFSNSLGLRGLEPGDKTKPRVVFVGDSFTWGWGIGKDSDRYVDRLQENFSSYEFINAGIVGFNTLQEYFLLQHYIDSLQPDYVVLQVFQNDFRENVVGEGIYPRPHLAIERSNGIVNYPAPDPDHEGLRPLVIWLGEHSYFYRQLLIHIYIALLKFGTLTNKTYTDPTAIQQQEAMVVALQKIIELIRQNKLSLLVIYSGLNEMEANTIESICDREQIKTINLDLAFDGAAEQWHDHTLHWTVYGHHRVADYLQPELQQFLMENIPRG